MVMIDLGSSKRSLLRIERSVLWGGWIAETM